MAQIDNPTATTFEQAYARTQSTQVSTPFGLVTIADNGRRVTFEIYDDIRQSIHHRALFSYYQQLTRRGITQINVDHLQLPGLDRRLNLKRGKARLDCCYIDRGKLHEVELKTHREIGLDTTREQLLELVKHCQDLILVVPRADIENATTVLSLIQLQHKVKVDTYELYDEE
jgi:hypothetical protein